MSTHGEILKNYLNTTGIKQKNAAEKLGVHVNTLRNWCAQKKFSLEQINTLFVNYPSIISEFGNVQYVGINIPETITDLPDNAPPETEIDWHKKAVFYQERYYKTLKRYNDLLEKYAAMQDKILSKCKRA